MGVKIAKPEHEVAYLDVIALCKRHGDKVSAIELLAIASNLIGKLIVTQDHTRYSRQDLMDVVLKNLDAGVRQAVEAIENSKGEA